MEQVQEREWAEAQKISVSVDLVEAAKKVLQFLTVVDRNRFLYEDQALERAIYRYNAFWLPLLAKHVENPVSEDPLVVPLDCEWIWHCHRLNPVQYKFDCDKLFGRILGNRNVVSSVQGSSKTTTEEIWKKVYPDEPYELDLNRPFSGDALQKCTSYDLVSAVKRQISFTFQVSQPYTSDDIFLQEAVARYKGFLHLIRRNKNMRRKQFCVPTYDVDLMWHTHQLHPDLYCKDMKQLVGFVVQHDDSDSDRSKGSKLDIGHSETTSHWEETFGLSYRKAGAMSRGSRPTPVTLVPHEFNIEGKDGFNGSEKCGKRFQLPTVQAMEVLLEFVDIKNLPEEYKENLVVVVSKKQPDKLFNTKGLLGISSNSTEKLFALFECEPSGEFLFELMSRSSSNELTPKSFKPLGSCSLSLKELLAPRSQLSTNKWVSVDLAFGIKTAEPVLLRVSISFTPPTPAPHSFQIMCSKLTEDTKIHSLVMDDNGKELFSLQTRNITIDTTKSTLSFGKEVYCVTDSGERHDLLEFHGNYWCLKGTHGSFKLRKNSQDEDSLFELVGDKMVKLFPGRRLDFEPVHFEKQTKEQDFMTAVEFSKDYPYGRAVALINSKSKTIKAIEEWVVLPGIVLAFMLSDFTTEGRDKENDITDGEHMVMNRGHGSQCIGQCGNCGDDTGIMDMAKLGYGSQCIGQCTNCGDNASVMDMAKLGYGSQCIGQCTNCGDSAGVMDMAKLAYGSKSKCGAPCMSCAAVMDMAKPAYDSKSKCGAPCMSCAAVMDMAKPAYGIKSKCGAPCMSCVAVMDMAKPAYGSKSKCGAPCMSCAAVMDMAKPAYGSKSKCGAPCMSCAAVMDMAKPAYGINSMPEVGFTVANEVVAL